MPNSRPSLSVIIPTYNSQEKSLIALQSVLAQAGEFEIIVVDDFSNPGFSLPENLPKNISVRLIRHDTNMGAAAARNSGIKNAQSEWICLLDGDDLMRPDTLQARFSFAQHHDQNANESHRHTVYACGWNDIRAHRRNNPVRIPNNGEHLEDFCSGCWFSPGSTFIARKQLFEQHIGYFDEGLRRLEDMDWFIRLGLTGGQLLVQPIVGLDILPANNPSLEVILQAGRQILEKHQGLQHSNPLAFKRLKAYINLEQAAYAAKERKYFRAAAWFLRSLMLVPRLRRNLSPAWQPNAQQ